MSSDVMKFSGRFFFARAGNALLTGHLLGLFHDRIA